MHFLLALLLAAAAPISGSWSIAPADAGRIHYDIRFTSADGSHDSENSRDADPSAFGIPLAQLDGSGHVAFSQVHDAGTLAFTGEVSHRSGGGSVTFTPSDDYIAAMRSRGYGDLGSHELLTAAMLDISIEYVDSIASAAFSHLSWHDLVSFRALKIDAAYIRSMRASFPSESIDPRDVISLRALGVTSDYVAELRASGLAPENPRAAIEFKALKIDASYIRSIADAGFANLTARQLVEFKALGIDGDFIKRVHDHGFPHPTAQQLVQLKAMHVI